MMSIASKMVRLVLAPVVELRPSRRWQALIAVSLAGQFATAVPGFRDTRTVQREAESTPDSTSFGASLRSPRFAALSPVTFLLIPGTRIANDRTYFESNSA